MIQLCVKRNYNVMKMYENIWKAFWESAVSRATFWWHWLFASGKEFVKDDERRGRTTIIKTFKNIAWVEQVLKKDCRVNCRMIVENTGHWKQLFDPFYRMIKKESYARVLYHMLEQWQRWVSHAEDLLSRLPMICQKSVRCDTYVGVILYCLCCFMRQISRTISQ